MSHYEYRVIPAPTRGVKAKGVKSAEARFAHSVEETMNTMAAEGWEYHRAETLPSTERAGLTSTTTTWRNLLVFRRNVETDAEPVAIAENPPAPAAEGDDSDQTEAGDISSDTDADQPR